MNTKLAPFSQHSIKANYEAVQKSLAELDAQRVELKNRLISLNFLLQVQSRGITRRTPVGFQVGNGGPIQASGGYHSTSSGN